MESYQKRLQSDVTWQLLPYSSADPSSARRAESDVLRSKIKDDDYIILLDERGQQLTSPALAASIDTWSAHRGRLVFVIGGAYGVDERLRERADFVWSLSSLVFPHQIVRLLLIEQLYRAQAINANHPYHH